MLIFQDYFLNAKKLKQQRKELQMDGLTMYRDSVTGRAAYE